MRTAPQRALLRVRRAHALRGSVQTHADLDIAARALVFAALSEGRSELRGVPTAPEALPMLRVLRELGVPIEAGDEHLEVRGVGLSGLSMPKSHLACERSWTSLALSAGLLAGQPFGTRITVHDSLGARSVEPIVGPLRARGAQMAGSSRARTAGDEPSELPPISSAPLLAHEALRGLRCELPAPDAAAKAAVLVSGLFSPHETLLSEPFVSADHTERMLVALGLPLRQVGAVLQLDPRGWDRRIPAQTHAVSVGCATCAAYLTAAALVVPHSRVALIGAGMNPSRTAFFDALRLWGANVRVLPRGEAMGREPIADLIVEASSVRGGVLGGELVLHAAAEIPALLALAISAQRDVQLFDLDAIASPRDPGARAAETLLGAFGIPTLRSDETLIVRHGARPSAARVNVRDDAELAMAAVVLGLAADGETVVEQGAAALSETHPGFLSALAALGAEVEIA